MKFDRRSHPAPIRAKWILQNIRSLLYWEAADRLHSGQLWFGDATRDRVNWIEAVALSFDFVASDGSPRISDLNSDSLTNEQLFGLLKVDISR